MAGFADSIRRDLREIYDSRNIIRSLVAKRLYGRYKNSLLGFAWNFITPIILMVMYYIIFTEIRTGSNIENRWVFISTAIFLYSLLAHGITSGTGAFTGNAGMIKKMYFPREILVIADAISSMIVCIIGYGAVLFMLAVTGYPMDWRCMLFLPLLLLLSLIFVVGCMFLLSSVTVYVRDIQYALSMTGIALFIMTPMRYMASDAPGIVSTLIWYNPLTYYIEIVHQILYFREYPSIWYLEMCLLISIVTLVIGYLTFRKLRHGFVKRL